MNYQMEELVPIVVSLTKQYTSNDSTSVTYDTAQQLMGAVIYCMEEAEREEQFSLLSGDKFPANMMYEKGLDLVQKKVRHTSNMFKAMRLRFCGYGNACLEDTFLKGMPAFFKKYNFRFDPQNTILTLDYPVLKDLTEYSGIDKIYNYLLCIDLEQTFMRKFTKKQVQMMLSHYNANYANMIDNLCEIVLMSVVAHSIVGKPVTETGFQEEDYDKLKMVLSGMNFAILKESLLHALEELVREHYNSDYQLMDYLSAAVDNIAVRLKNGADHGNLSAIV